MGLIGRKSQNWLPKRAIILDWDDTASLNPKAFLELEASFLRIGMELVVCTSRAVDDPTNGEIYTHFPPRKVIFCEGETKKRVLERLGITPIFWVDDTPESIVSENDVRNYNLGNN